VTRCDPVALGGVARDRFAGALRETGLTRRDLLRAGAAAGALAGIESLASPSQILERALATSPSRRTGCAPLSEIEHVAIFVNENRSFDRYFGNYRGVRGFSDPNVLPLHDGSGKSIFAQPFPGAAGEPYGGHLLPFHFDTTSGGECVNDISHEWKELHECWNGGALDKFLEAHLKVNPKDGHNTMGYYTRQDLPFFHALAENFTLCDRYFCSVIGPTDANRLYSMSATIDLSATEGPSLKTQVTERAKWFGRFTWRTYPEQLQAAGISWKIYSTPDGDAGDDVLHYFKAYEENAELKAKAFTPQFPADFRADCQTGMLAAGLLGAGVPDRQRAPAGPRDQRRGRARRSTRRPDFQPSRVGKVGAVLHI
jgi:phospholipase C